MPLYVANMSSPLMRENRQSDVTNGSRNYRGEREEGGGGVGVNAAIKS